MSVLYCSNCGAKLNYSGAKPKFCSSCGTPVAGGFQKTVKASTDVEEEDSVEETIPNINGLQYDVSFSNKVTFEDVINSSQYHEPSRGPVRPGVSNQEASKTSEQIINETMSACKSSRAPQDIDGE
tara:strand:+ start:209 stop:586 length:378 start_codon:yes stop_codon:yes gene_type:complete